MADWKPDFSKTNPYEGVPNDYLVQIEGTQAYNDAVAAGWISPELPTLEEQQTYEPPLPTTDTSDWKPDFTQPDPWAGMPEDYEGKKTFVPTPEVMTPPWEPTPYVPPPVAPETTALPTSDFKPDFTKDNPYEGMDDAYKELVERTYVPTANNPIAPTAQYGTDGITVQDKLNEISLLQPGFEFTPEGQAVIDALNNPALRPYLVITLDGNLTVDIGRAAAAGIDTASLITLGFSEDDIDKAKQTYTEYIEQLKDYDRQLKEYQAEKTKYDKEKAKYNADIKEFESSLNDMPSEIQLAYKTGGIDAYNKAVDKYNKDQEALFKKELSTLPQELQDAYNKGGYDGLAKAIEDYNKKIELQQQQYDMALSTLEPYKDKDGIYDITKYLKDVNNMKGSDQLLKNAGFSEEDIKAAQYQSKLNWGQQMWQGMTPWEESRGEKVSVSGATILAAELLIPGVYVARRWNDLSTGEKVFAIAIDAVSLIPLATAAARGARIVSVTGRATTAARLAGAGKGLLREVGAQITAPINVIIHPIGTAKTTFREVAGLMENIASPRRLPEASVSNIYHTVKLREADIATKGTAKAISDEIVKMAAKDQTQSIFLKYGDNLIEFRPSKLMKELGGGAASGTPFGELLNKKIITVGENNLAKEGMYFSPTPAPRFSTAASTGAMGKQHTLIIASPDTAKKLVSSKKLYRGTAELEGILPEGEQIKIAQKLYTRVGATGQYTEILLEKPLSLKQIAKLKLEGLAETFKQPFQPVIKATGKGSLVTTLTKEQTEELARVLRASGNTKQATSLMRAYNFVNDYANLRATPPKLATLEGRVEPKEYERAAAEFRREIGYVQPVASRPDRITEPAKIERVTIKEPERRISVPETEERLPGRITPEEPERKPPALDTRQPFRVEPKEPERFPPRKPPSEPTRYPPRKPPRYPAKGISPKPRIYPPGVTEIKEDKATIPQGSITWEQGLFWKFIPPPWDKHPISLPKGVTPKGAKTDGRTPFETIQMIGKSTAKVPKSASIDLGIVDVHIEDWGKRINFTGGGEKTVVGKSDPSATRGISIPGVPPIRSSFKVAKKSKPKTIRKKRKPVDYDAQIAAIRY